jgi:hypothetical protein
MKQQNSRRTSAGAWNWRARPARFDQARNELASAVHKQLPITDSDGDWNPIGPSTNQVSSVVLSAEVSASGSGRPTWGLDESALPANLN